MKTLIMPVASALLIGSITIAAAQTGAAKRSAYAERYYGPTRGYTQLQQQWAPAGAVFRGRSATLPDQYGNYGAPSGGGSTGGMGGP